MTLSELQKWRKRVPYVIFVGCALPWPIVTLGSLADVQLAKQVVIPLVALVAAFFYVGLELRDRVWSKEVDAYVGQQIRETLLDLIPSDLQVSPGERQVLAEWEIFKKLTGPFWEAVDRDEQLRNLKEHFYANGLVYTTAIDVYLIGVFCSILYIVSFFLGAPAAFLGVGGLLLLLAVASRVLVIPRSRKKHLALSSEQLDLLRRRQGQFVSNRLRDLVLSWRLKGTFD